MKRRYTGCPANQHQRDESSQSPSQFYRVGRYDSIGCIRIRKFYVKVNSEDIRKFASYNGYMYDSIS